MAIIIRMFSRHRIRAIRWKKNMHTSKRKIAKVALQSPSLISQISSWIRTILSPRDFNISLIEPNFGVILGYSESTISRELPIVLARRRSGRICCRRRGSPRIEARDSRSGSSGLRQDGSFWSSAELFAEITYSRQWGMRGGLAGWKANRPENDGAVTKDSIELQKSCDSTLRAREIKRLGGPFLGRSIHFVENLHILWYVARNTKFLTTYKISSYSHT